MWNLNKTEKRIPIHVLFSFIFQKIFRKRHLTGNASRVPSGSHPTRCPSYTPSFYWIKEYSQLCKIFFQKCCFLFPVQLIIKYMKSDSKPVWTEAITCTATLSTARTQQRCSDKKCWNIWISNQPWRILNNFQISYSCYSMMDYYG